MHVGSATTLAIARAGSPAIALTVARAVARSVARSVAPSVARSVARSVALAVALGLAACGPAPGEPRTALPVGVWGAFEGEWSAAGTRTTLHLGPDHRAAVFHVTGSLLLTGERKIGVGFQAEAIGFSGGEAGMTGRCVWTDEQGDQVYSELEGAQVGTGNRVTGTILGGTGRFAGVTGDYAFEWQYVVEAENGAFSGRAVNLAGRACIGPPPDGEPPGPAAAPGLPPRPELPPREDGR
jgi:hypothetical protein